MFNLFDDIFNSKDDNKSLFTSTDIKTILGRNIVLNFLGKIEIEVKTQGFSDTANDIADFYESCKSSGGIVEFFTNPVIKMILSEIQSMPSLRSYLNTRIFDDIEQEKVKNLDKVFNNNDDLYEQVKEQNQEYMVEKEKKRKEIVKLQKKHNLTFKQAEEHYNMLKQAEQNKQIDLKLDDCFKNLLNPTSFGFTGMDISQNCNNHGLLGFPVEPLNNNKIEDTKQINLDDDISSNDDEIDDNSFWN